MVNEAEIKKLMGMESEMMGYDGEDKIITSYDVMEIMKNMPKTVRYMSGLRKLDDITAGFGEGQLVAVSGWTKCGKTSFCQTLTYNYARQDIGCLWFTYELSIYEFILKFNGNVPIFCLPQKLIAYNIEWVEKKIIEASLKYNAKMVFIDNLHFMFPLSNNSNLSIMIGHTIRQLKIMAVKYKVVIFILCHTTKVESGEKPTLSDIRDSSFIAQESDITMMMSRKDFDEEDPDANNDTSAKLRILANRHNGKRGLIDMDYENGFYKEIV